MSGRASSVTAHWSLADEAGCCWREIMSERRENSPQSDCSQNTHSRRIGLLLETFPFISHYSRFFPLSFLLVLPSTNMTVVKGNYSNCVDKQRLLLTDRGYMKSYCRFVHLNNDFCFLLNAVFWYKQLLLLSLQVSSLVSFISVVDVPAPAQTDRVKALIYHLFRLERR